MRSLVLAAGLMAAVVTTGARAADLDDGPPPDRYGSAYDDPRYADIYKYPQGPGYAPPPYASPYAGPPPYAAPIPRERVYREGDDYAYPPARRYSYAQPVPPYAGHCLPREVIKNKLIHHGWGDFHDGDLRGDVAVVHARRPSGRLFLLKIDRCSGDVLSARPLEGGYGPYAYGPRRWERFY
jgi:hypothetical protein